MYLAFYSSTDSAGAEDIGIIKFHFSDKTTIWQARFGGTN